MSLIVLASDKGSPGVTTTAVALAGVWPRRAILAECDPSGGDLVYRTPSESGAPLNPNIGMLSLATTARHGLSAHQLEAHLQRMHGGLEVVAGLATGDQSAGLAGLWTALGRAFDSLPEADVIADCGRVDAAGPALDLMAGAALVVLVARTSAEQMAHVRDRALSLVQRVGGGTATAGGGLGVPIGVVLIVDPKQRTRATAQVDELLRNSGLPVKVIGTIADDPDGADLINGRGRGRLDRTLLIRSTREVALELFRNHSRGSQGPAAPGGQIPPQQVQAPSQAPTQVPPQGPPPGAWQGPPPPQTAPGTGYTPPPSRPNQPTAAPRPPRPSRPAEPTVWPSEQPHPGEALPPPAQSAPAYSQNGYPVPGEPHPGEALSPPAQPAPAYSQNGYPVPSEPHPGEALPPPASAHNQNSYPAPHHQPSAHETFTSVTLGGGPDPRPAPSAPPGAERDPRDPRDPRNARENRDPRSHGEIPPGTGSRRAGPPNDGGRP
ncbi:hypothetical protein GCM10009839_04240 [Catenulispora yoronensis]|uniref:CobQ/CobB/MinD/ParA nucleotide binding domain-containing protein n=1 Tax=Catenulispora yoronensis TaxID=450799 RepID=A0ABP5F134_9ACTN